MTGLYEVSMHKKMESKRNVYKVALATGYGINGEFSYDPTFVIYPNRAAYEADIGRRELGIKLPNFEEEQVWTDDEDSDYPNI